MAADLEAGTLGHLTAGEERKLQEAWNLIFELGGVDLGPDHEHSPSYKTLKAQITSAEGLRDDLWRSCPPDHPDVTVLRFLRARKWDVEKGVEMLVSSLNWRVERQIHENIIRKGDSATARSGTSPSQLEKDLVEQYRTGKSYVRGTDNENRPVYVVKVRLHHPSQQSAESMETYVLHIIETITCMMQSPREKCCLIFDLTGFGLKNMDFHLVKFLIHVFEARYPETLGVVLVHNAPFVFWGIWSIVKPLLDPVVAAKITFTSGDKGLAKYIPHENLQKSYGGGDPWEYRYIEPIAGENERLDDEDKRALIQAERDNVVTQFEQATIDWIRQTGNKGEARAELAEQLRQNYWKLDPYVRARTLYHRAGVISVGGVIDLKAAT